MNVQDSSALGSARGCSLFTGALPLQFEHPWGHFCSSVSQSALSVGCSTFYHTCDVLRNLFSGFDGRQEQAPYDGSFFLARSTTPPPPRPLASYQPSFHVPPASHCLTNSLPQHAITLSNMQTIVRCVTHSTFPSAMAPLKGHTKEKA